MTCCCDTLLLDLRKKTVPESLMFNFTLHDLDKKFLPHSTKNPECTKEMIQIVLGSEERVEVLLRLRAGWLGRLGLPG